MLEKDQINTESTINTIQSSPVLSEDDNNIPEDTVLDGKNSSKVGNVKDSKKKDGDNSG